MIPPDAALVRRVLAGDREAFRGLVDRHYADALRVATHLLGDAAEAEDVVQETFVRAYRHLGSYEERDRFRGWLWRILVNRCRTAALRRRRRPEPVDDRHLTLALDGGPAAELPVDPAEAAERRAALHAALATLPADLREAVVLRFADGLSYAEMAGLTGLGVSALKMRVHRACSRLRTLLASSPAAPVPERPSEPATHD